MDDDEQQLIIHNNIIHNNNIVDGVIDDNMPLITIPNGFKSIGNRAFAHSTFREIVLPESLTSIGEDAFRNCIALEKITIPNVTIFGENAFQDCTALVIVHLLFPDKKKIHFRKVIEENVIQIQYCCLAITDDIKNKIRNIFQIADDVVFIYFNKLRLYIPKLDDLLPGLPTDLVTEYDGYKKSKRNKSKSKKKIRNKSKSMKKIRVKRRRK